MIDARVDNFVEVAWADGTAARWAVRVAEANRAVSLIAATLDAPGTLSNILVAHPQAAADADFVEVTWADGTIRRWATTEDESDRVSAVLEDKIRAADTLVC